MIGKMPCHPSIYQSLTVYIMPSLCNASHSNCRHLRHQIHETLVWSNGCWFWWLCGAGHLGGSVSVAVDFLLSLLGCPARPCILPRTPLLLARYQQQRWRKGGSSLLRSISISNWMRLEIHLIAFTVISRCSICLMNRNMLNTMFQLKRILKGITSALPTSLDDIFISRWRSGVVLIF